MLTAKHIDTEGNETLYEVIRVRAIPNPDGGKQPIEVITVEPNGHTDHYKSGRIFVMNESGSTVSNWIIIPLEEKNEAVMEVKDNRLRFSATRIEMPKNKRNYL